MTRGGGRMYGERCRVIIAKRDSMSACYACALWSEHDCEFQLDSTEKRVLSTRNC